MNWRPRAVRLTFLPRLSSWSMTTVARPSRTIRLTMVVIVARVTPVLAASCDGAILPGSGAGRS